MPKVNYFKIIKYSCGELPLLFCIVQGCDCAANWLIVANSDPSFVISEISVNQVRKCVMIL